MNQPKIHILLVEDDLVDRMACRRALHLNGDYEFILSEADNGREGLQAAHAQKPDCVLLDYHLPDMTGLEFLAALRNDVGDITVPVMMLTGADNASVAVEAMKCGAHDYMVKDTNRQYLELLPAIIQHVLRDRQILLDKKHMESRLVQAEAQYRILVEQIPAITYTAALDTPGKLLYVSPQLSTLGYAAEEWVAHVGALRSYIHPDDRTAALQAFDAVRSSGEPLRCEYRLFNRDGEVRWFRDEASVVHDEAGLPLLLQGMLIDITRDKQVEEELNAHRRRIDDLVALRTLQFEKQAAVLNSANANLVGRLNAFTEASSALKRSLEQCSEQLQNVPCAIFSLDAQGAILQINDAGLTRLGSTREAVMGKRFTELLTPAAAKSFSAAYPKSRGRGGITALRVELVCEDGSHTSHLLSAAVMQDGGCHIAMLDTAADL